MKSSSLLSTALTLVMAATAGLASAQSPARFKAHDMGRPRPPVVQPAPQALPVPPPPDAVVLFDGKSLSEWRSADGGPAKWVIKDGAIESVPGSGYLHSARGFGDISSTSSGRRPCPRAEARDGATAGSS
jgi:hypothetical protein